MTNPFADNPLRSRVDLQRAVTALWRPVAARLSRGGARARLGYTAAHFSDESAELEGFSRPLWGLVPLAAGGAEVDWEPHLRGLAAGTDPEHTEYWGRATDRHHHLVEMAAIGHALALVPDQVWAPLEPRVQRNLARWLSRINEVAIGDNNWLFFQVLVNEGLYRVGASEYDPDAQARALDRLESFYLGDGWYSDGPTARRDYYGPWAIHFYGLMYAHLAADRDPQRVRRFRDRATAFAHDFVHWFADDGSALPFGRSLTYRFAQGAFWGALAFAEVEALPWGQVKGLALRHLRWWAGQPIFDHAGLLTIGYRYPSLTMAEEYNAPGSPYWATKIFLPLALPDAHPFWQADEAPMPQLPAVHPQSHAGMLVVRDPGSGHVTALASGQQHLRPRHGAAKYGKFAYSTAFGFSVPAGNRGLEQQAADSMLAVSDDDVHWRVRESLDDARLEGDVLWSRWRPWPDVEVETWLVPRPPWHVCVHRIHTMRPLFSADGGFAIDRTGDDPANPRGAEQDGTGEAWATYPAGATGVRDLIGVRRGQVVRTSPNTNLLHPRACLPTLRATHDPGEHWLMTGVLASTNAERWAKEWDNPPSADEIGAASSHLPDMYELAEGTNR